ncbi:ubiquitin carboxyl-terminal hydrolase 16 [Rhizophagus clarus]|uniref:Ubiquitin carboxyl-terminal hydrolase n=1 Tax=Rhizophagus clarus TaxID=94130 RepID=A0A8H3LML1_9GLOM|nr:ubiquitin carboxyl-terminal hydrolase 16 [Rhizophagus clarus]
MASQNNENITMEDNEIDTSRDTTENISSDDDSHTDKKCRHVKHSVKVKSVEKKIKSGISEIYCMTCKNNVENPSTSTTDSLPVDDAVSPLADIWICLVCAKPHCGRNTKGHAVQHNVDYKEEGHHLSLNMEDLQVWCYECNKFIIPSTNNNQVLAQAQGIVRKYLKKKETDEEDNKEPYGYDKPKRKWQYEVTAPGLSNLGNTCFFNSVMQVVVGTSVLHDVLTPSEPYYDPPHIDVTKCIAAKEDGENDAGPLTNAFKEFLREMWRTREDTVAPRELFNQISKKWQQFRGWRQQDSQELMRFLFDGIKSEELELIRKLQLQSQEPEDEDEEIMDDSVDEEDLESHEIYTKKEVNEKYVSFIDACFGGKLVSVIVCDVCKNCSYSYEEFLDVSLPIRSSESKNSFGYDYSMYNTYPFSSNLDTIKNNEGNSSQTQSEDGSEHEDENHNGEANSDTEIEEGIPVPTKEERERIKLLLRDLPSDSGRSTPNSSKEPVTLRDCLKSFVKVETLENDNSFACDNCWKLKEEYDKQIRENERITNENDTDDQLDDPRNTEPGGNGVQDMVGVEYTVENNVSNNSPLSDSESLRIDNGNSSDASDTAFLNNNPSYSHTNSLTTKSSKSVSQPERTYILRKAYKRYLFDSLPPVLVFHLKRFQQVGGRWSVSMKKIDDFVAFDEELDVGDFVVPPEIEKKNEENGVNNGHIIDGNTHSLSKQNKQHTKYRLYGVVVHLGSLYNGHYIAYVLSRNIRGEGEQYGLPSFSSDTIRRVDWIERQKHKTGSQRQWIYCSDNSVRAASVEEVLNSGAYLLFYERVYE